MIICASWAVVTGSSSWCLSKLSFSSDWLGAWLRDIAANDDNNNNNNNNNNTNTNTNTNGLLVVLENVIFGLAAVDTGPKPQNCLAIDITGSPKDVFVPFLITKSLII